MTIKKATNILTIKGLDQGRDARSATLAVLDVNSRKKTKVTKPTFDYINRSVFHRSEFNLTEIGTIEDVESYVRQAFQKKTSLMFKEGEEFTGKNIETIKYLKKRIAQMEYVSGQSFRSLLRSTGYNLISRSNYFWVKVRSEKASGGRTIAGLQPVAAYFGMAPENVEIKKDKTGVIIKYRQMMPDGRYRDFDPQNVIHFYSYKKDGYSFGNPQLTPVKEDIRSLRRIEENVELLIYQTLFPIFQYKVGTETKPATDIRLPTGQVISEVDYVRGQIREMPAEGGIVTPERHEIKFIGAEGKALKAKEYLDYFKARVLSGLGVSSVDMGEGSTANRATADSMSKSMIDSVKDYQDILEDFLNLEVINELLIESTFDFDVLAEENIVKIKFKEIDIEEQLKKNTNGQVLYNGNIIDINEARAIAGYQPISPEQEELMFSERVSMKENQQQIDASIEIASTKATEKASKQANNSNAPTNQHGTKTGPQKSKLDYFKIRDGYVEDGTKALANDISNHVKRQIIKRDWIDTLFKMNKQDLLEKYYEVNKRAFRKGFVDAGGSTEEANNRIERGTVNILNKKTESSINKLLKDMQGRVSHILDRGERKGETRTSMSKSISDELEKIQYRGKFIDNTERMRAYNYGKAISLKNQGFTMAALELNKDCDVCSQAGEVVDLEDLKLDNLPPFHPNSTGLVSHGIN